MITIENATASDAEGTPAQNLSCKNVVFLRSNEPKVKYADLKYEEAIIKGEERFGRTRNSLLKHLRAGYGRDVADRALQRINKRRTEGHLDKN